MSDLTREERDERRRSTFQGNARRQLQALLDAYDRLERAERVVEAAYDEVAEAIEAALAAYDEACRAADDEATS